MNVLRDDIREGRSGYYVIYQPADDIQPFATLALVFLQDPVDATEVACAMEAELNKWLTRYPVPLSVHAHDMRNHLIHIGGDSPRAELIGYCDPETGRIIQKWTQLSEGEFSLPKVGQDVLMKVYSDLPAKDRDELKRQIISQSHRRAKAVRAILFLVVAVPVLIEFISLGIPWLAYALQGISIIAGFYKVAKALGFIQPGRSAIERAERERLMRHYFWHCERNPEGFRRLRSENFTRIQEDQTRLEAQSAGAASMS